jgi:cytochrome c oxidase cbb3-type subunit 3
MRTLITRYLGGDATGAATTRGSATPSAPTSNSSEIAKSSESGVAIYALYCVACHGERGRGDGPNASHLPVHPAAHADARLMSTRSDDRLFDAIAGGGYPLGRSVTMPPFGATLSRAQIWLLVGHLRTLCRCSGPAWARPAAMRPEHGAVAP